MDLAQDSRIFELEQADSSIPDGAIILLPQGSAVPVGWMLVGTIGSGDFQFDAIAKQPFIAPTITGLTENRVYQRSTDTGSLFGRGAASVPVTLQMQQAYQSVEYRLRDAASAAILQNWTACSGSGNPGPLNLSLVCPARVGRYLLDFRIDQSSRKIVQGSTPFSVGAVILGMGQSQQVRTWKLADGEVTPLADLGLVVNQNGWCYTFSNQSWARPADGSAFDSPFAAVFLDMEIARRGVSCAYVGAAQGSTTAAEWLPGTNLWGRIVTVMNQVKAFEGFVWHLGGTDHTSGVSPATYKANLETIISALTSLNERGTNYLATITAMASRRSGNWASVQGIRRAAKEVADAMVNAIYCEPRDVTLRDQVHQDTGGNVQLAHATARHFAALAQGQTVAGPVLTSAAAKGQDVTLQFSVGQALSLVGAGDWHTRAIHVYPAGVAPVEGSAGRLSVVSGDITAANQAVIRLGADPNGPVDVYIYNHPDPSNALIFAARLSDNFTNDGVPYGRQAVPSTDGPVVSTYEPGSSLLPAASLILTAQDGLTPQFTSEGRFGSAFTTLAQGVRLFTPGSVLPVGGSFAMECWFRSNFDHTATGFIMGQSDRVMVAVDAANEFARLSVWASQTNELSSVVLTDDQWHHIAVQYNAGNTTTTMFVDGQIAASLVKTMSNGTGTTPFAIGGWATNGNFRSRGIIDEVAIWQGLRFAGQFTPPSAPHNINSERLMALWRLNGNLLPENPA